MTDSISAAARQLVSDRALGKCEYCRIDQKFSIYTHEVDHIIASKHGGETIASNLALSCFACNRHKGSDIATFDSETGDLVLLFNPRIQNWSGHFSLEDARIVGKTSIGRATVFLLKLNTPSRVLQRQLLIAQNVYP